MTHVHFSDLLFGVDKELTRSIYQSVSKGGATECTCSMCKNYSAINKAELFPNQIIQFFEDLGIDINKDYEIYHMNREGGGLHFYGGWFNFAGCIIQKGSTAESTEINPNFSIAFAEVNKPANSFFDKVENVVQVDLLFKIPWIISDEEPE